LIAGNRFFVHVLGITENLAISLPTGRWDTTWIVWPVAGVMYAVGVTIAGIVIKAKD